MYSLGKECHDWERILLITYFPRSSFSSNCSVNFPDSIFYAREKFLFGYHVTNHGVSRDGCGLQKGLLRSGTCPTRITLLVADTHPRRCVFDNNIRKRITSFWETGLSSDWRRLSARWWRRLSTTHRGGLSSTRRLPWRSPSSYRLRRTTRV